MKEKIKYHVFNYLCLILISGVIISCGSSEEPTPQNTAPTVVNATADVNLEEGFEVITIGIGNVFFDGDNDQLSFTFTNSDESVLTISLSDQTLTITEVGIGVSTITLTANDGSGGSVTDSFMVAVNAKANTIPTIANALSDLSFEEGFNTEVVDFSNVFEDSDGDVLNYNVSSSDENVAAASINGTNLTISEIGLGNTTITLRAMDGNGGMISDEFAVTINAAPNNAPTVANAISDLTLDEGFDMQAVDISNVFEDSDGDPLTYTVSSSDVGVATVSLSGTVATIKEVGNGSTSITVTAADSNGGSVSDIFDVTINASTSESVTITFGTNSGNSIEIANWTAINSADGYVIVMSDVASISNRTDGQEPLSSTTYIGTGEQVIFKGSTISTLELTLLEATNTYYFKVFPYTGSFTYDNSQNEQESSTLGCSTSSTTQSEVCFDIDGDLRTITSNQYPSHDVGSFPNADPTAISITRALDLTPEVANSITYVFDETGPPTPQNKNFWQFGIATNGVEFHPMGLKPWTIPDGNANAGEENWEWQTKVAFEGETGLDAFGAHVTSQGNYHYHGDIVALADTEDGTRHSLIYGFAGDGFPIYYKYGYTDPNDPTSAIKELKSSHQLKSGSRTGTGTAGVDYPDGTHDGTYIQDYEYVSSVGDLDECNGRTGVTPEYPDGTYYYVITVDFPVTPNCFKGTPDTDWQIGK